MQCHKQAGATLLVALVMLVILTLFAITAINFTNINTKIVGNTQLKKEAEAASQQAIEQVISTDFTTNPQPSTVNIDINNDGTNDYAVAVPAPACLVSLPIKLVNLDIAKTDDRPCFASGKVTTSGYVGAASGGASLCSNTQWDVQATVTDPNSGAKVTTHQGISKRVAVGTPCS